MLITSRRRIRLYSAPFFAPGQYPRPDFTLPLGVESIGFTGRFRGTVFKYGPMAALAAVDEYYVDDAWFTGPTYNITTQAEYNAFNFRTVPEWSTIVMSAGVTFTKAPHAFPRRTGWDPTAGGGLVRIVSSARASILALSPKSNGVAGTARRVSDACRPFMYTLLTTSSGSNVTAHTEPYSGGWVIEGAIIKPIYGTASTAITAANVSILSTTSGSDPLSQPSYIIYEKCHIESDETGPGNVVRGVQYIGKYCAFIDCNISGFIYDGGDSQAIWISSQAQGWLGIFNTRMRALSQGFIIGGNDPPAIYRASHRPKNIDCRYSFFDPDGSGKWTLSQYAGESKATYELKTGEDTLVAFCRASRRMYSGSYEYAFIIKSADQQQTDADGNPIPPGQPGDIPYAAAVYNHTSWCNHVLECNAGAMQITDRYPASALADGCDRIQLFGNLFGAATKVGQPGGPPTSAGVRALITMYNSNGPGGQDWKVHHNTAVALQRFFEGPSSALGNPQFARLYVGENVNMHTGLNYGPVTILNTQAGTFADMNTVFQGQMEFRNNLSCTTTPANRTFPADLVARNNISAARADVIEDYAGGNYRVKTAYQGYTSDGLAPGAPIDLIQQETANLG